MRISTMLGGRRLDTGPRPRPILRRRRASLVMVAFAVLLLASVAFPVGLAQASGKGRGPKTGTLEICSVAGSGVTLGTPFTFDYKTKSGPGTVAVPAGAAPDGSCVGLGAFKVGKFTVTQVTPAGQVVTTISATPSRGKAKPGSETFKGRLTPRAAQSVTFVTGNVVAAVTASSISSDGVGYCVVLSEPAGAVDCWGQGGLLGDGSTADAYVPVRVTGITTAVSLATDRSGYCAVLAPLDSVDCWGDNNSGELGDGTTSASLVLAPVPVCDLSHSSCTETNHELTGVASLFSDTTGVFDVEGYCAVLTTGSVDCWGDNIFGQLGDGTTAGPETCGPGSGSPCAKSPVAVCAVSGPCASNVLTGVAATPTGLFTDGVGYCAVLSSGSVDCWGENIDGQLGNGAGNNPDPGTDSCPEADANNGLNCDSRPGPVDDASGTPITGVTEGTGGQSESEIAGGYCVAAATVDCWGDNEAGELGIGTTEGDPTPGYNCGGTPSQDDFGFCWTTAQYVTDPSVSATSVVSDSQFSTCAVLTSTGVDCWGGNLRGSLGTGSNASADAPLPVCAVSGPCTSDLTGATSLATDNDGYCAVVAGTVACWGGGTQGQLGQGADTDSDVPVPAVGVTGATAMASDSQGYCAVENTGAVDCWGDNTIGQLGVGTSPASSAAPLAVPLS